jgi:heme/copper-type cytochrome/quinol oxidase subunit 3
VIDVSALPEGTADSRALLWWAGIGMMVIEGTMFAMMIATDLYLQMVNRDWPPPTVAPPGLTLPTVGLALLLLSFIPARIADRAALRDDISGIRIGFILTTLLSIAFLVIRVWDVSAFGFKWSSHAYGSVVWTIIGLHTFHIVTATGEIVLLAVYSFVRPLVKKQLLDVRVTAVYWYFVIVMWLPFYWIVYVAPHFARRG